MEHCKGENFCFTELVIRSPISGEIYPTEISHRILTKLIITVVRGLNLWRTKFRFSLPDQPDLIDFLDKFGATVEYLDLGWSSVFSR